MPLSAGRSGRDSEPGLPRLKSSPPANPVPGSWTPAARCWPRQHAQQHGRCGAERRPEQPLSATISRSATRTTAHVRRAHAQQAVRQRGQRAFVHVIAGRAADGRPQRGADQAHVLHTQRAGLAPAEVRFDRQLIRHRQLTVDQPFEQCPRVVAADVLSHVRSPSSSARSDWRARVSRDFTVPTATPSENAISS